MAKKPIPQINVPIMRDNGSMELAWYLFLQWVSENAGVADLSDYFTKEEIQALLDDKANVDDLSDYFTKEETQALLDDKADDNAVVHLAKAETITGIKTFNKGALVVKNNNTYDGTNHYNGVLTVQDSTGAVTGYFRNVYSSANSNMVDLQAVRKINDTTLYASLGVAITETGDIYAYGPNIGTSSNSKTATILATKGWVNDPSLSLNIVHRDGTETINGTKTFNSTIESGVGAGGLALRSRAAAGTNVNMDLVQAYDSTTGQRVATIRAGNGTNQRVLTLGINNFNNSAPTGITVWCDSNNNVWATAPNSDANGSIVTTSTKSKNGSNGYFQFGNGLIVQWGLINSTGGSRNVTFPKAFSAAGRYSVTVTPTGANTGVLYMVSVNNNTSTGFTVLSSNNTNNVWLFWIAIGY